MILGRPLYDTYTQTNLDSFTYLQKTGFSGTYTKPYVYISKFVYLYVPPVLIANLTHTNLNSFTSMSNRSLTVAVNINGFKYVCVCLVRTGFPLNLEERKRIRIRMRVWDLRNRHSVSLGLFDLHIRIRLCTDYFSFSRYVHDLRKRIQIRLRLRIV